MRRLWLPGAGVAALALAGLVVARKRLLIVRVHGSSMEPAYHDGDALLLVRMSPAHGWRRGEDLVFAMTGQELVPGDPPYLVKRVCAVPGDPDPTQSDGLVPPDWLVLQGLNATGPRASYYSVSAETILGKVVLGRGR